MVQLEKEKNAFQFFSGNRNSGKDPAIIYL